MFFLSLSAVDHRKPVRSPQVENSMEKNSMENQQKEMRREKRARFCKKS